MCEAQASVLSISPNEMCEANLAVSANSLAFFKKIFSHEKHTSLLVNANHVKIISVKHIFSYSCLRASRSSATKASGTAKRLIIQNYNHSSLNSKRLSLVCV